MIGMANVTAAPATKQQLWEWWARAREEACQAYGAWCAAPPEAGRMAYAIFLAASDREAAAEAAFTAHINAAAAS